MTNKPLSEADLSALAKKLRIAAGKNRSEAARELGVSHVSILRAEEDPQESLVKLRIRIIELYSAFKVTGPVYHLEKKRH